MAWVNLLPQQTPFKTAEQGSATGNQVIQRSRKCINIQCKEKWQIRGRRYVFYKQEFRKARWEN